MGCMGMYGKLFIAGEKKNYVVLLYRHRLPGRVGNQTLSGRVFRRSVAPGTCPRFG